MRIVAGSARGRRLAAPANTTRPTSDRAREALFNSLTSLLDLADARVLDLFAGTGAVGLEALSRGARETVLVESGREALAVLNRNVAAVGLPGATVVGRPVAAYLEATPSPAAAEGFDFVFADPPYAFGDAELAGLLATLAQPGRLADEAVVVVERSARGAGPHWPPGFAGMRERRYGEGVLWYGRRR